MREPPFEQKAPKRTVSLTLNSDLYAKAKTAGINASKVAENALAAAYAEHVATSIKAELQQDLEAANAYAEKHSSFADLTRAYYGQDAGAV
jgi:post-segregation antitoxin (ccd killing protein)